MKSKNCMNCKNGMWSVSDMKCTDCKAFGNWEPKPVKEEK